MPQKIKQKWHHWSQSMTIANRYGFRQKSTAFGWVFLLGLLVNLSLPPVGFFPILFVCFPLFYLLVERQVSRWHAALIGWWFGFGFFVGGLYWITNSILIAGPSFWWMVPFALFGLPIFLALFISLMVWLWYCIGGRGFFGLLSFASLWIAAEYLRGHILTGLPWNLIGYSVDKNDALIQGAAVVGVYGIGLWVMIIALMPVLVGTRSARKIWLGAVLACLVWWGGGAWRLALAPPLHSEEAMTNFVVRLVQPNIPQTMGMEAGRFQFIFKQLFSLSFDNKMMGQNSQPQKLQQQESQPQKQPQNSPQSSPLAQPNAIIWPEGATEILLEWYPNIRQEIAAKIPAGTVLITGTPRAIAVDRVSRKELADQAIDLTQPLATGVDFNYYNGLIVLNHENEIVASYNKYHLVPFGEYVPFSRYLPIEKIVEGLSDFSKGTGPAVLTAPPLPPFLPIICYEGIFPDQIMPRQQDNYPAPQWLLSLTNDGWFGNSSGPYQHLTETKWRSVEQGLPLIRVANNGISAVVDSYGRVIAQLPLNLAGIIDAKLPKPLSTKTIYNLYVDKLWILVLISIMVLYRVVIAIKSRTKEKSRTVE